MLLMNTSMIHPATRVDPVGRRSYGVAPSARLNKAVITVALIDDHALVRKALVDLINAMGRYRVVLEARHGAEYQELVRKGQQVDIAIVALNLPLMDGYETLAWITAERPTTRALALTFEATDDKVIMALRNGARGVLLKNMEPCELETALVSTRTTGYYHNDLVHHSLMNNLAKSTSQEPYQSLLPHMPNPLTARELEFIALVCRPDEPTYEQMADSMGVSRRTVDGYRVAVFQKCGIKSKSGVVLFATKFGVIKA